ncbi:MAG TPA: Hsp20/alpha crystallin family protein [Burkholderiales bacterium]
MANPSRFGPIEDVFNELTRGFLVKPLSMATSPFTSGGNPFTSGGNPMSSLQIRLDLKEDDMSYQVRAEIPGVKKEDIHVDVDGSHVTLRAEVREESEQKNGGRIVYSERSYGMLSRGFDLPGEVDPDRAKADYKDGVLCLTLPKKAGSGTRRVNIT